MSTGGGARFWIQAGLACVSAILFALTAAWPQWFEAVFGIEPDGGSGALEWLVVAVLLLVTVTFGALAHVEWRRSAVADPGSRASP